MDSDLVLISRVVLLNDERAFADLMKKYQRPMRRYFLVQTNGDEALSDDLAQETFIHAWQHLDSFHGLSGFGTWLYRIAHNTWCNWYARHHDLLSLDDPVVSAAAEASADSLSQSPSSPDEGLGETSALRLALARLSDGERTCITLFYYQELSIREIHAVTGYPVGTIKSHLARARASLKQILSNENR